MSLKSFIARKWASYIRKQIDRWAANPIATQENVFRSIIQKAKHTAFGRDHHFEQIHSYEDFVRQVPIRDYEALAPYIERVKKGEENILWPGKPLYFAKTSGTTSGAKYIPLTKDLCRTISRQLAMPLCAISLKQARPISSLAR